MNCTIATVSNDTYSSSIYECQTYTVLWNPVALYSSCRRMIRWEDGTGWCFIESLCWTGWSSELWDGLYTAACPGSFGWKTENTVSRYPRITLLLASIIISITSSYTMNKNRIFIHSKMYQVLIFAVSVKVNMKFYFNVTYSTIQKGSARFAFSLVS